VSSAGLDLMKEVLAELVSLSISYFFALLANTIVKQNLPAQVLARLSLKCQYLL
jgi:hypothetical protein